MSAQSLNDELFSVQEKLSEPSYDVLSDTKGLIEWSKDDNTKRVFLLSLTEELKIEQLNKYPKLLVLQTSIYFNEDYSGEELLPFIREHYIPGCVEVCEFILEDKQGSLSDEDYQWLLKVKKNIKAGERKGYLPIKLGVLELGAWKWIDGFGSTANMSDPSGFNFNSITRKQYEEIFPNLKPYWPSRQSWVYEMNPEILDGGYRGWKSFMDIINERMIFLPSSIAEKYPNYKPDISFPKEKEKKK